MAHLLLTCYFQGSRRVNVIKWKLSHVRSRIGFFKRGNRQCSILVCHTFSFPASTDAFPRNRSLIRSRTMQSQLIANIFINFARRFLYERGRGPNNNIGYGGLMPQTVLRCAFIESSIFILCRN